MRGLYQPSSGADLVAHALNNDPDRPVIILGPQEMVTAGQLRDAISRYVQLFDTLSPKPVRAALLSKNRPEVPGVFYAFSFAGIISTPLHPMGSLEDYHYVLGDAGIDTLIYDEAFEEMVGKLAQQTPGLKHLLAIGKGGIGGSIDALSARFTPGPLIAPAVLPDDIARIAYSGGTTGQPKGILIPHRSTVASTTTQLTEWEWPDEVRHLICSPLSHAGASVLTTILHKRGAMFVLPSFDPVSFMQAIEANRITSTLMVPTMVLALIDHPRFGEFDLSSLEVIFYGASAFPPSRLKEAIAKLGPIFFQFYGQTEAPLCISAMRKAEHLPDDPLRLASCGRQTPWVQIALLDDDCQPVADGQPGEICVRGPQVMLGYLNKPEETEQAFKGGWLHTGDVAVRNPDGFLRIVDRKKDMIITGGFNVFAREVEDVIATHSGVAQVAVIGLPDAKWGEAVTAIVVASGLVEAEELIALVRTDKGPVQAPKRVIFVDAIPLSAVGKPDKKALRARFAEPVA